MNFKWTISPFQRMTNKKTIWVEMTIKLLHNYQRHWPLQKLLFLKNKLKVFQIIIKTYLQKILIKFIHFLIILPFMPQTPLKVYLECIYARFQRRDLQFGKYTKLVKEIFLRLVRENLSYLFFQVLTLLFLSLNSIWHLGNLDVKLLILSIWILYLSFLKDSNLYNAFFIHLINIAFFINRSLMIMEE